MKHTTAQLEQFIEMTADAKPNTKEWEQNQRYTTEIAERREFTASQVCLTVPENGGSPHVESSQVVDAPFDLASFYAHLHQCGAFWFEWRPKGLETTWHKVGDFAHNTRGRYCRWFGVHPVYEIPPKNARGNTDQRYIRSQNDYISAINCLYGDFDAKDFDGGKPAILAHLDSLPLAPSVIIDSGGGYHVYWLLTEPFAIVDEKSQLKAQRIQRAWVKFIGSDYGAKDLARVLRVAGSRNYKAKYAPDYPLVSVVKGDLGHTYNLEDFEEFLPDDTPLEIAKEYTDDVTQDEKTAQILDLLPLLDKSRHDDYSDWLAVGMILHNTLNSSGLALWDDWSKASDKYQDGACAKKWPSFAGECDRPKTIATLIYWARIDTDGASDISPDCQPLAGELGNRAQDVAEKTDGTPEPSPGLDKRTLEAIAELDRAGWRFPKIAIALGLEVLVVKAVIDAMKKKHSLPAFLDDIKSLRVEPLDSFMDGPTTIEWIVDKIAPRKSLGLLVGEGGIGKTWLALQLGLSVAAGIPYLGQFATQQGPVLIVDEENADVLLRVRIGQLMRGMGLQSSDLSPLHFLVGAGVDLTPLKTKSGTLGHTKGYWALYKTIALLKPSLVIFDSLTRVHHADENRSHEMSPVFNAAKKMVNELGCSVLFTHHTNKSGGYRGSTDIFNSADWQLKAVVTKNEVLQVEHDKARWDKKIDTFGVEWNIDKKRDSLSLAFDGDVKTGKVNYKTVWEFIKSAMESVGGMSRQDLIIACNENGICSTRKLDDVLKWRVEKGHVKKEPRGKSKFYSVIDRDRQGQNELAEMLESPPRSQV